MRALMRMVFWGIMFLLAASILRALVGWESDEMKHMVIPTEEQIKDVRDSFQ